MFLSRFRKTRLFLNTTIGVVITVFFLSSLVSAILFTNNKTRQYIIESLAGVDSGIGELNPPGAVSQDKKNQEKKEEASKQKEKETARIRQTESVNLSKLLENINISQPPYNTNPAPQNNTQQGLLQNMSNPQPPYNSNSPNNQTQEQEAKIKNTIEQLIKSVPNNPKPPSSEPCAVGVSTSACFCSASYCYWNDAQGKTHQINKSEKGQLTATLTILDFVGALSSNYGQIKIDKNLDGVPDVLATVDNLVNNPHPILNAVNQALTTTPQTNTQANSNPQVLPNLRPVITTSNVNKTAPNITNGQISIPLSHIAAAVFAEASNGTDPVAYQALMSWVLINRAASDKASPYTQALAPMLNSILGNWSGMSLEQATQKAIDTCLGNPNACSSQSSRFAATLSIVQEIYNQFINGAPDPTGGSIFFSKQSNLKRGNLTFKSSTELQMWLAQQAVAYAQKNNNFQYVITEPIIQNVWSPSKGTQSTGQEVILYICNDPCCADASCR